jgi:hypothetical protein
MDGRKSVTAPIEGYGFNRLRVELVEARSKGGDLQDLVRYLADVESLASVSPLLISQWVVEITPERNVTMLFRGKAPADTEIRPNRDPSHPAGSLRDSHLNGPPVIASGAGNNGKIDFDGSDPLTCPNAGEDARH